MEQIQDEINFKRYLYFLTENQYYVVEKREHTFTNKVDSLMNLLAQDKIFKIIEIIEEASKFEWLPDRNVLFHVLALCANTSDSIEVKTNAYTCAAKLIKTTDELFQYITYERALKANFASGLRRVLKLWYLNQDADKLFDAITSKRSIHGWTHRDVLRMAHFKAVDESKRVLIAYACRGLEHARKDAGEATKELLEKLESVDKWRYCKDEKIAIQMTAKTGNHMKEIPGALTKSPAVWAALVPHMSLDQLINELGRFHRLGMLRTEQPVLNAVVECLGNAEKCRKSGLLPATVLLRMKQFERPRPMDPRLKEHLKGLVKNKTEGDKEATPAIVERPAYSRSHAVTAALGRLLHHSLRNVRPLPNQRRPKLCMVTIEVRGKKKEFDGLLRPCFGCTPVRYGEVAALTVLMLQRMVSAQHVILACFNGADLQPVQLDAVTKEDTNAAKGDQTKGAGNAAKGAGKGGKGGKKAGKGGKGTKNVEQPAKEGPKGGKNAPKTNSLTLAQVLLRIRETGAQCNVGAVPARPLRWALDNRKPVEVFVNILVTEDGASRVPKKDRHSEDAGPLSDAIQKYRQKSKIPHARVVNIALCGRSLKVQTSEKSSNGLLNIVGFNPIVPALLNSFLAESQL